jgi:hypothetical protein
MRAVFPSVYIIDVERYGNSMVIGTKADTDVTAFARNTLRLPEGSVLRTVAERSLATGNIREVAPGGRVFTDDHAPVELVVDQIILGAAREREEP